MCEKRAKLQLNQYLDFLWKKDLSVHHFDVSSPSSCCSNFPSHWAMSTWTLPQIVHCHQKRICLHRCPNQIWNPYPSTCRWDLETTDSTAELTSAENSVQYFGNNEWFIGVSSPLSNSFKCIWRNRYKIEFKNVHFSSNLANFWLPLLKIHVHRHNNNKPTRQFSSSIGYFREFQSRRCP